MNAHVHRTHRSGWLRAAVLGANDGLLTMSGLVVGVAAAQSHPRSILAAGVAGLAAGMLSMGAGEYVSVSSQADLERAEVDIERRSLRESYDDELAELASIYTERGLDPPLARQVAQQMMSFDALAAHMRDDIGISTTLSAQPIRAALTSCTSFAAGALGPLLTAFLAPPTWIVPSVVAVSLVTLCALGVVSARLGGAPLARGTLRVLMWGVVAMAGTGLVGALFGAVT
ncbi:MAG: VIT family protein [Cupriavidus sp.]|nr:VIT family protein [Cupriavidus sp.]